MKKIDLNVFLSDFDAIVRRNEPIVTRIPDTMVCRDWTIDSLVNTIGDQCFNVSFSKDKLFASRDDIKPEKMMFADFIQATLEHPGQYSIDGVDIRNIETLIKDAQLPEQCQLIVDRLIAMDLWIGSKSYTSNLHFDAVDNVNLQIYGSKSFILYPPQISGFKCRSIWSGTGHISTYKTYEDMRIGDASKQIDLERCQHIVLNAGEMLYLPFSWWHEVKPLSEITVNLNYFWKARAMKYIQYPYQTASAVITMLNRLIQKKPIA